MRFILLFFSFIPYISITQHIVAFAEPIVGTNYYKSIEKPWETKNYKGVGYYYGIKAGAFVLNRVALTASIGDRSYPFDDDYFFNTLVRTYFFRNHQTEFSVFTEIGFEVSDWGGPAIPFYIGTSQYFGDNVSFNFRMRLPTFLDRQFMAYSRQIEAGFEAGLQFDFPVRMNKKITKSGNPFLLH